MDMSKTEKTAVGDPAKVVVEQLINQNTGKIIAVSSVGGIAYIDENDSVNIIGGNDYAPLFANGNYMSYYLDPVMAAGNTTATKGFVGALLGTCSYYDNWVA